MHIYETKPNCLDDRDNNTFSRNLRKIQSNILPHNHEEQPGCKLIPKRRSFIQAFDFKIILKKQEIIMISTPTQNY